MRVYGHDGSALASAIRPPQEPPPTDPTNVCRPSDSLSPTPPPRTSSNARCELNFCHRSTSWQVPPSPYARHTRRFANTSAQSSEARLYTFSDETKTKLRKFRLGTSRAKDPQAVICSYTYCFCRSRSCHCPPRSTMALTHMRARRNR